MPKKLFVNFLQSRTVLLYRMQHNICATDHPFIPLQRPVFMKMLPTTQAVVSRTTRQQQQQPPESLAFLQDDAFFAYLQTSPMLMQNFSRMIENRLPAAILDKLFPLVIKQAVESVDIFLLSKLAPCIVKIHRANQARAEQGYDYHNESFRFRDKRQKGREESPVRLDNRRLVAIAVRYPIECALILKEYANYMDSKRDCDNGQPLHAVFAHTPDRGGSSGKQLAPIATETQLTAIRILLDAGANVDALGKHPHHVGTPLHRALETNADVRVVQMLLNAGARPYYNYTADLPSLGVKMPVAVDLLRFAVQNCVKILVIQALLDGGAQINRADEEGWTALFYANVGAQFSMTGSRKCVRWLALIDALLQRGANVNAQNIDGYTPLMHACQYANRFDDSERISILLRAGADVNLQSRSGVTALTLAMQSGNQSRHAATVRLLLQAGANPNSACTSGHTPLMEACSTSTPETIRMLLDAGAEIRAVRSNDGMTCLMLQCSFGVVPNREEILRMLLEAGVALDAVNHSGQSALIVACRPMFGTCDPLVLRVLVQAGANVNLQDATGMSPLMTLASVCSDGGLEKPAQILLSAGANIALKDSAGRTALAIAVDHCSSAAQPKKAEAFLQVLREFEANVVL